MKGVLDDRKDFEFELDSLRIVSLLEEILLKLDLLGKINEAEDNSSELAGFEINKLLKEQTKLEGQYNDLVRRRNKLKSIEHRAEYQKLEAETSDVSRSLKESTKKLCRLFKENKNLNEDLIKVGNERKEVIQMLKRLIDSLNNGSLEAFEKEVIMELEGHNRLQQFQNKEKDHICKLKNLKTEIASENRLFKNEMNEKNMTVNKLQEEYNRTRSEINVNLKYQQKEIETNSQTKERIFQQKEELLLIQKAELLELYRQETNSFSKARDFLQNEQIRLKEEAEIQVVKLKEQTK